MKILEVKNNLVKISYTAKDNLVISGFVIIEDSQYPYVAQIMSLKAGSGTNYAIVKLLFTFNEEGVVKNYNGTIPELEAAITPLSSGELLDILPVVKPLTIGKLAQQDFILEVDYSVLEKNLLICSDNTENSDILLSNLTEQITGSNDKSIVFDVDGTINAENRLVFGEDFKIPLNYDSINFIYENDLNDIEPTGKALIQDIFLEVQEYSKTVLDNFIPIDNFISVVDSQYRELNIPELLYLKNRLLKYKENQVFAQSAKDIHNLRGAIRANLSTLVDISTVDSTLQKLVISYVYDEIEAMDLFMYSLVKINSENADKKLIRKFLTEDKIYTSILCPHNYKYLYELKERASNMILFAPQTLQHDFASYNVFLNKLNSDECVIYGKATQNIPLILEITPLENYAQTENPRSVEDSPPAAGNEDTRQGQDSETDGSLYPQKMPVNSENSLIERDVTDEHEEFIQEKERVFDESLILEEDSESETTLLQENAAEDAISLVDDEITEETLPESVNPLEELEIADETAEFMELPQSREVETEDERTIEESDEEEQDNLNSESEYLAGGSQDDFAEEDSSEYVQDLEEIASVPEEGDSEVFIEQPEDILTEDDLDYIGEAGVSEDLAEVPESQLEAEKDEYAAPEEGVIQEYSTDEPYTEEAPAAASILEEEQVVPIYPAESPAASVNNQSFEAGDRVSHPKYGEGVVEKMIKYGNKILCSISFANGRRLLDPTISQLEKI